MKPDDSRPDPDALIAAAEAPRARLKLFLGAAPGVGKTWEMLAEAKRLLADGQDVVAGLIETHGRAETEAQLAGIPLLPRRAVPYRGHTLSEFDLDAALARRPALLLVDELAHTNAPGSRHAKRWEDVAELLQAGIPVWTTLNVQHLESLNDDIARITGIRPAETLPDSVLELADEIELIDLPPADLRTRMREGRIYRGETARRALDGFFTEGNLAALREIALRRAAAHVGGSVRSLMRRSGIAGPWPSSERVLALIGAHGAPDAVVRHAKRLADSLQVPWLALHVETATEGAAAAAAARAPLALAADLGAEILHRTAPNDAGLVAELLAVARARNATYLVIGRRRASPWRRLLSPGIADRLLRQAPDFVVQVVPVPPAGRVPEPPPKPREGGVEWLRYAGAATLICAVTAAGETGRARLPVTAADMVYLAAVVTVAAAWGTGPALLAAGLSLLAWDFFFVEPIYALSISDPRDIITAVVFAAVAVLTGGLAGRVRGEAKAAAARIEGLRRIAAFSRRLGVPATEHDLLTEIVRQAAGLAGDAIVLVAQAGDDLLLGAAEPQAVATTPGLDEGAWAAARWAVANAAAAGQGTRTLPSAAWRFIPMRTTRGVLGALGVRPGPDFDATLPQALDTLADQAAVALERVRLANEAARGAAMAETQKLRTALLASLGHDLRTPLTGIRGAASTLRTAWTQLTEDIRADLLASIEEDVGRMARFLANITDLTRLETGEIHPRLGSVAVGEIVEAAIARMPGAKLVTVDIRPPRLCARADAALLEQVLFNILDNAAKYSPSSGLIRLRAFQEGHEVRIATADEGVGIPAEDLPHVFDSFFRVQRRDRVIAGTGLGLAIARGMIEAMGGRIEAQSPRPDMPRDGLPGTVVTLTLPVAAPARAPAPAEVAQ
jgi:two-component system sensor histidine kinase KdpD